MLLKDSCPTGIPIFPPSKHKRLHQRLSKMLESAIPRHLQKERSQPNKTPTNYEPPFPAYCARFQREAKDLVMAIIGAQFSSAGGDSTAMSTINKFMQSGVTAPQFSEMAAVTDEANFYNLAVLAYWPSKTAFTQWTNESGFDKWWSELRPEELGHGWFREVFFPPVERFETVFSNNEVPEGAAHMRECVSGPLLEHVYWGSMRDRLPISQTNALSGDKAALIRSDPSNIPRILKQRVTITGKKNLCVIRSGQDWLDTYPDERELYVATMHPVLVKGMEFLRDHGEDVGCYSCRFMDVVDPLTKKADKDRTFGLAYFDELASLERWSKEHQTHLDIFGGFLQYAKKLNNNISLRLFHEVLVLEPDQQQFEYIACHERTGMLRSLQATV